MIRSMDIACYLRMARLWNWSFPVHQLGQSALHSTEVEAFQYDSQQEITKHFLQTTPGHHKRGNSGCRHSQHNAVRCWARRSERCGTASHVAVHIDALRTRQQKAPDSVSMQQTVKTVQKETWVTPRTLLPSLPCTIC